MYLTLVAHNIPTAQHIIIDREGLPPGEMSLSLSRAAGAATPAPTGQDPEGFVEGDDYVEKDNVRISKPFVEKPFDGDDHNVYIYYPSSMVRGPKFGVPTQG